MKPLQWGLLASGNIAKAFAAGLKQTDTGKLLAVGSRTQEKADAFAKEFGIPKAHGSFEALLADAEVEAVYISTPHPMHAEWAIKAAKAGKHILCEKPAALNHTDTAKMIRAAQRHDVFFMEAFMYRCNPQTARVVDLIRNGAVGKVRQIVAAFGFCAGYNPESRLFNPALGGGGILDVGCYAVSMSRLIAGAALGRTAAADPLEVQGAGHIGESHVDEWAAGLLRFEEDIVAHVSTGVRLTTDNTVGIYGSDGDLKVLSPWFCNGRNPGQVKLLLTRSGKPTEEIVIDVPKGIYALEADTVAANIGRRQAPSPAMTWEDTLGNMKTLDRWRKAIGLRYPGESDRKS